MFVSLKARSSKSRFIKSIFLSALGAGIFDNSSIMQAATINPLDATGSFGSDPVSVGWQGSSASAVNTVQTVRTTAPWIRPATTLDASSTFTTFQAWDVFTNGNINVNNPPSAPGANSNSPPFVEDAAHNGAGTAQIRETTGTAFLTGGGNIYSFSAVTKFALDIPNYAQGAGFNTNYLLQIRSLGTGLDTNPASLDAIKINGIGIDTLPNFSFQTLENIALGGMGGSQTDYKFEFTLPGNSALDTITFASAGSSMSLDRVSLDTSITAVPEPTTWAAIALSGLVGAAVYSRRLKREAKNQVAQRNNEFVL
jgi:hypothetical protein